MERRRFSGLIVHLANCRRHSPTQRFRPDDDDQFTPLPRSGLPTPNWPRGRVIYEIPDDEDHWSGDEALALDFGDGHPEAINQGDRHQRLPRDELPLRQSDADTDDTTVLAERSQQ